MYHVPMCVVCGEQEVGSQIASTDFCSGECLEEARTFMREVEEDGEPHGSYDLSDDGDALAAAGFGTDEDYNFFGEDF